jgi:hypothetical protein
MIDFPCAVHLENYNEIKIATDEAHLDELRALGYITSAEWYAKHLNVDVGIIDSNDTAEDAPKRRGRPAKSE